MPDYKIVDAEKLNADLTSVANSIRKRAGTTAKMEFPTGFESVVENIPSGGAELPTLENPGDAYDLAKGKQMIDQHGNVVTGTLGEATEGTSIHATGGDDAKISGEAGATSFSVAGVYYKAAIGNNATGAIVRPGARFVVRSVPTSLFGDATAADVVAGKTFTSAAGLKVTGMHECEEGATLPTLTHPATASDLALDKQLIDAEGNVVTGTLADGGNLSLVGGKPGIHFSTDGGSGVVASANADTDRILRAGDKVSVVTAFDEFGDATAADVAAGKTFTSAAGLKVVGTASGGTGGGFTVTDDGAGNVTITSDAITDNDGDVVIA